MKTTIQYNKSNTQKDVSKVTMFQDGVEVILNPYYYTLGGKYYLKNIEGQSFEVASSESEFKEYILDKVLI